MVYQLTKEDLIQFGQSMEMEGRGYFFESYVSKKELESLPEPLRTVTLNIQENLQKLDSIFIELGVDPEEFEC